MNETMRTKPGTVLLVTTIGAFLSTFAGSSVNVALPSLGGELGLSGLALNWVSTAFVLGTAVILLPMGRFGDIFGRKRLLAAGCAVFAAGSCLSGLAPTGDLLIAGRALTGIGSSMLAPTAAAILVASYPPKERGRVLGLNVAAVYLGLSAGPFIGGFVTVLLGWRGLLMLHVVLAAGMMAMVLALLRDQWRNAHGEKMDWAGSAIYAAGLSALLIGFSELPGLGGMLLLLAGAAALGGFVAWELKCRHPLLNVRLFRGNRAFALSNLAAMISYSATFSVAFFLSLYLQVLRGLPPQAAGLLLVAQPVVQAVFSPLTGRLSDRVQPRFLASVGMACCVAGLALLAIVDAATPLVLVVAALVLLGLGFALFSSPNTNAVMGAVEHKHLGIASATISTMRVVGMAASMGLALVLFSVFLGQAPVSPQSAEPFMGALRAAFAISAVLCFLGIFASLARGKVDRA
jgi:EmrB/QacA subfamily drug resistance transporter